MRVAIIQDWLTGMRGGEKCLEVFCNLFPEATIFTLLHKAGALSPLIESMTIRTSFLQHFPRAEKWYRNYLPFFPAAIEDFDLREFDFVLSSSHCAAKGVVPAPHALHICYCHTPMRYIWDVYHHYFGPEQAGKLARLVLPYFATYLRMWDVASSQRVDYFIANSRHVQRRIWRYYRREAAVIHPPVDTEQFALSENHDNYFLIVSALVPYKRIDLAIAAFNRLGERLVIVGNGPKRQALQKMAGKNIEFVGWQDQDDLVRYYARCRALIFPGEEDFGIVPLEAQACGKPVIAYAAGGALESLRSAEADGGPGTGIFFDQATPESLIAAVQRLEALTFDPRQIRAHALQFDRALFQEKIKQFIAEKYEEHQTKR